jgi:hypothetical protein
MTPVITREGNSIDMESEPQIQIAKPEIEVMTDKLSLFKKCPECEQQTLAYEEGCAHCLSCGMSVCSYD